MKQEELIESIVNYETAKILKEKGFSIPVTYAYDNCGEIYHRDYIPHDFNIRGLLSAPTQTQVQSWLRNVHNINVWIEHGKRIKLKKGKGNSDDEDDSGTIASHDIVITGMGCLRGNYKIYEEAMEAGLLKAINLLK